MPSPSGAPLYARLSKRAFVYSPSGARGGSLPESYLSALEDSVRFNQRAHFTMRVGSAGAIDRESDCNSGLRFHKEGLAKLLDIWLDKPALLDTDEPIIRAHIIIPYNFTGIVDEDTWASHPGWHGEESGVGIDGETPDGVFYYPFGVPAGSGGGTPSVSVAGNIATGSVTIGLGNVFQGSERVPALGLAFTAFDGTDHYLLATALFDTTMANFTGDSTNRTCRVDYELDVEVL